MLVDKAAGWGRTKRCYLFQRVGSRFGVTSCYVCATYPSHRLLLSPTSLPQRRWLKLLCRSFVCLMLILVSGRWVGLQLGFSYVKHGEFLLPVTCHWSSF